MKSPSYSLKKYSEYYAKVADVLVDYENSRMNQEAIDDLLYRLYAVFEGIARTGTPRNLRRSLNSIVRDRVPLNENLKPENIKFITKVLAGWYPYMKQGALFKSHDPVEGFSWALLFVNDVEPTGRSRLYKVNIMSYGGYTAGRRWRINLPGGLMQNLIRGCGGLKYGQYHDYDLATFWITSRIGISGNRMEFRDSCVSASQKKHNRMLLDMRSEKCSGGFTDGDCFNCPLGRSDCRLSRHQYTYDKGVCRCPKPKHKGYLMSDGWCLKCKSTGRNIKFDSSKKESHK